MQTYNIPTPSRVDMSEGQLEGFNAFWKAYPSRGGYTNPKNTAKASYLRALRDGTDPETLTRQAHAYSVWCRVMGWERTRLVAMAATWLNQARWEADYTIGYHLVKDMDAGLEREAVIERINEALEAQT